MNISGNKRIPVVRGDKLAEIAELHREIAHLRESLSLETAAKRAAMEERDALQVRLELAEEYIDRLEREQAS